MNSIRGRAKRQAFALMELLALAFVLLVLLLMLLPARRGNGRPALSVRCLNNLRQVAIAAQMFAEDHKGAFPGGASSGESPLPSNLHDREHVSAPNGSPAVQALALQPYLNRLDVWFCLTEKSRRATNNAAVFNNQNMSYFLSLDATPALGALILAGDRHLKSGNQPVPPGIFQLKTNLNLGWTRELHATARKPLGSLTFVDGHAELGGTNLTSLVRRQPLASNRLAIP